uniref:Uncharacterized protein n=1 Tax=Malurus cyaneus samueli TaxID=2593467 RepID=A0A8C5TP94_9PASS
MQTSGLKESLPGGSGHTGKDRRQLSAIPLTSPRLYFMFFQLIDLHLQGEEGPANPLCPQRPPSLSSLTHKTLLFAVPEWGCPDTVGDQREERLLHLQARVSGSHKSASLAPKVPPRPWHTCRDVSKTTSLELVGIRS